MTKKRYKHTYTTARQWGGDDGYQWAVFIKGQTEPVVSGLTRREVPYYRDKIEKREEEKHNGPKPFTSLRNLCERAEAGEKLAQQVCIGALQNLGCEHLEANDSYHRTKPRWYRCYRGLLAYLESLVGEYNTPEEQAEIELLAELNAAQTYSDDIEV